MRKIIPIIFLLVGCDSDNAFNDKQRHYLDYMEGRIDKLESQVSGLQEEVAFNKDLPKNEPLCEWYAKSKGYENWYVSRYSEYGRNLSDYVCRFYHSPETGKDRQTKEEKLSVIKAVKEHCEDKK